MIIFVVFSVKFLVYFSLIGDLLFEEYVLIPSNLYAEKLQITGKKMRIRMKKTDQFKDT